MPRYDLAAYELQKLFLDPADFVVPPTALRMVALEEFAQVLAGRQAAPSAVPNRSGGGAVLAARRQGVADVYDQERFAADPVYARHIGQLNVLTYLIEHRDSNVGNFLIGKRNAGRVFSRSTTASPLHRRTAIAANCGRICA